MSDVQVQPAAGQSPGLTQWQRVADVFTAPSKTFEDIKRGNTSWWLPFVIMAIVGYLLFAVVSTKVGMQQVVDNQIRMNPSQEERLAQAPPEQRQMAEKISLYVTEGIFIANPLLLLAILAIGSLILMATINFGFGGKAKFGSVFSVWMYAGLPGIIKVILGIVVIFAGVAPESFNIKNYAPTNFGAFLNPMDTNKALYALASSLDIVTIWTLILLGMGLAIVAGVKRPSGYMAVFGWFVLIILVSAGWAAMMG
jgi:Yip1 domain